MKRTAFLVILVVLCLQSRSEITGFAFLENQMDHSGIKVKFIPQSPSAQLDSVYTSTTGSYGITIMPGVYKINFTKDGYFPYHYNQGNNITLVGSEVLNPVTMLEISATNLSGSISGTLTSIAPYHIIADVYVPEEDTLIIEAGTEIFISANCNFTVNGLLQANGAEDNPITITSDSANPSPGYWGEFEFQSTANDESYLQFCSIAGGDRIYVNDVDMDIKYCNIQFFNTGLYWYSGDSINVSHNVIDNCRENALTLYNCNHITIKDNLIQYTTIYQYDYYAVKISNSQGLFENNILSGVDIGDYYYNFGLYLLNSNSSAPPLNISNNIIHGFKYGTYFTSYYGTRFINNFVYSNLLTGIKLGNSGSSMALIQSNIVINNGTGISFSNTTSTPEISYNLVYGNTTNFNTNITGLGQIITVNANGDPCDPFFNISLDPEFVDPINLDFHLYMGSPAIDAGKNDNVVSEYDFDGFDRIMDGNGDSLAVVDMGVYESPIEYIPTSFFTIPDETCVYDEIEIYYEGNVSASGTYHWDFDGGVPTPGSGQGPYSVYWALPGTKVVSLYVEVAGLFSDTTYNSIEVYPEPATPAMPSGPAEVCQGSQGIQYVVNAVANAETYQWQVIPAGAAVSANVVDTTVFIDWSAVFSGNIFLKVRGGNQCGWGDFSEMLPISVLPESNVFVGIEASSNPICEGEEVVFTTDNINGGDDPVYEWALNGTTVGSNSPQYVADNLNNQDEVQCYMYSSILCPDVLPAVSNLLMMEVNENPWVEIAALPNDTVCISDIIILDAGYTGGSYLWSTGETTQQIDVSNTSGPAGGLQIYSVDLTDENGCPGKDTIAVFFDPCTGINSSVQSGLFEIYPNPVTAKVNIEFGNNCQNGEIEIFSIVGERLISETFGNVRLNKGITLDMSDFEKGIYFLKITSGVEMQTYKLVKN